MERPQRDEALQAAYGQVADDPARATSLPAAASRLEERLWRFHRHLRTQALGGARS